MLIAGLIEYILSIVLAAFVTCTMFAGFVEPDRRAEEPAESLKKHSFFASLANADDQDVFAIILVATLLLFNLQEDERRKRMK